MIMVKISTRVVMVNPTTCSFNQNPILLFSENFIMKALEVNIISYIKLYPSVLICSHI